MNGSHNDFHEWHLDKLLSLTRTSVDYEKFFKVLLITTKLFFGLKN